MAGEVLGRLRREFEQSVEMKVTPVAGDVRCCRLGELLHAVEKQRAGVRPERPGEFAGEVHQAIEFQSPLLA